MQAAAPATITFSSIPGQDKAKRLLARAAGRGRLSHAYLFKGPPGTDMHELALAFAAYLNCRAPLGMDACGQCPSCRKYASGNHPDFHVIEPDGAFIKIDQVREIKRLLTYPPFENGYRFVLFSGIHTMRREAANSLLKTLEEPPPYNILILTCNETVEVLPTILSRCQIILFSGLPTEALGASLTGQYGLLPEVAEVVAAVAEGSRERACRIVEAGTFDLSREVIKMVSKYKSREPAAVEQVFKVAAKAAELKEMLPDLFDLLKLWLRDLCIARLAGDVFLVNRDLVPILNQTINRWDDDMLRARLGLLDRARAQLLRNCNRALVCEVLFFSLF